MCVAPAAAYASQRLSDVNVKNATLAVNGRGEALVSYTMESGTRRHVLVWGALNAREPNPHIPQVRFELDNSGGWKKYRRLVWKTFKNQCRPYDGPKLDLLVAACKAPDGSYWALQSWQRIQPLRGLPAFKPSHMKYELHLSHWSGPLADLDVSPNWAFDGRWQGVFGRLRYHGVAVRGYKTPTQAAYDAYARFFYIDTLNSPAGPGWKRASAVLTRVPTGAFCLTFVPLPAPPGYPGPMGRIYPSAAGDRTRVTVLGPGVTPILRWEGAALGAYDRAHDAAYNRLWDHYLGSDRGCAPER
jgi:hypothetical protein